MDDVNYLALSQRYFLIHAGLQPGVRTKEVTETVSTVFLNRASETVKSRGTLNGALLT